MSGVHSVGLDWLRRSSRNGLAIFVEVGKVGTLDYSIGHSGANESQMGVARSVVSRNRMECTSASMYVVLT